MPAALSYADAVRLLGGKDSGVVAALEKIGGGLLLGGTVAVPALLSLFDAKAELVRLSHELVRGMAERRSGLSRFDRTQRLAAAHVVIAVSAFFEALAESDLPFRFGDLELTKAEQLVLAGGSDTGRLVEDLLTVDVELGGYQQHRIGDYYAGLAEATRTFVTGLAVWQRLDDRDRRRLGQALTGVPDRAGARYEATLRRLAADFPEVACWLNVREHRETRAGVRQVDLALEGLGRTLDAIATGRAPDQRRTAMANAYRASLRRPIAESGEVPDGLVVPSLGEAYVVPRFRFAEVDAAVKPSDEYWWAQQPVRDDLDDFLIGHLTSARACRAPLVVLGQPGSGKSVFTRLLAARLPAADFLPVRVILRDVPAAADLQDQIENAIRTSTGERVAWPDLVRSAGDALPVVLLDGFDELLQAAGVSQTDYLIRVADFQRREAEQGRPVAVVVTSRTAVADRARNPEEMVALRLEPFDDARIAAWLDRWNHANTRAFLSCDIRPLTTEILRAHRTLAEQPLLLLMLALYDADGNALQRATGDLAQYELYERLLHSFAGREVDRYRPGLPAPERAVAVEEELLRLSVIAFAMFNRASLWVTDDDLDADLGALFGPARAVPDAGLRTPLRAAERALGRFFFIHRARATVDDARRQTYEFLHATFGEFLVARQLWRVLNDLAAMTAAVPMSLVAGPVDDGLLRSLLSFAPITSRAPIIDFLAEAAAAAPAGRRTEIADLLLRLFRAIGDAPPAHRFADYRPRRLPEPARYACYTANLVLATLCVRPALTVSELFGPGPEPVDAWRRQALLWRSQLSEDDWADLVDAIAFTRVRDDDRRDIRLELAPVDEAPPLPVDPYWTFPANYRARGHVYSMFNTLQSASRRQAYLLCSVFDDMTQHALEPLVAVLGPTTSTFIGAWEDQHPSAAHVLLDVLMLPVRDATPDERGAAYQRCATVLVSVLFPGFRPWDDQTVLRYAKLLLDRLAADPDVTPGLAAAVLEEFDRLPGTAVCSRLSRAAADAGTAILDAHGNDDAGLTEVVERLRAAGADIVRE